MSELLRGNGDVTGLLAVVAVVGYMATAGLPWWVVVAVALLMAGFAAGRSGSPGKGSKSTVTPGGWDRGARSAETPGSWDGDARNAAAPGSWDRGARCTPAPASPREGAGITATPGPVSGPVRSSADAWSSAPPVTVKAGAACPDE